MGPNWRAQLEGPTGGQPMRQTIIGLAPKPADAQRIIDDLVDMCVCDRADISLVAGETAAQTSGTLARAGHAAGSAAEIAGAALGATLNRILGTTSDVVSHPVSGFGF